MSQEIVRYNVPVKAVWVVGTALIAVVASGAAWMTSMSISVHALQRTTESVTGSLKDFVNEIEQQSMQNREAIATARLEAQTKQMARQDREALMGEIRALDRAVTRLTAVLEHQTTILDRITAVGRMEKSPGEPQ